MSSGMELLLRWRNFGRADECGQDRLVARSNTLPAGRAGLSFLKSCTKRCSTQKFLMLQRSTRST